MKENSTAGTPAKAVKEYALLSMGRGRILRKSRLKASGDSVSPESPPRSRHFYLHFSIPAGVGECHLFIECLSTVVRGVHLDERHRSASAPFSLHSHEILSSPAPVPSCLLQDILNEAD